MYSGMEKCKCERCGRIRDLFQYTKFETNVVIRVIDNGPSANPRYSQGESEDIGEKRGLCEECAVELNKRKYDLLSTPVSEKGWDSNEKEWSGVEEVKHYESSITNTPTHQ